MTLSDKKYVAEAQTTNTAPMAPHVSLVRNIVTLTTVRLLKDNYPKRLYRGALLALHMANKQLLDNGLWMLSGWTPPYRVEGLTKLMTRVKRVADRRGVPFSFTMLPLQRVGVKKGQAGAFYSYSDSCWYRYIAPYEITHGEFGDPEWEPIAVLEPVVRGEPESPVFVKSVPNTEEDDLLSYVPEVWNGYCDHCETRRNRKQTVLVRHKPSGEVRQVGSNCLFDYTGIDPELLTRFYDFFLLASDSSEEGYRSYGYEPSQSYPLYDFLVLLGRWLCHKNQYVQNAGKMLFASRVSADGNTLLSAQKDMRGRHLWTYPLAEESVGMEFAEEALNMLEMVEPRSSFDYNLKTIADAAVVPKKMAGYAGAIWKKWFTLSEKGVIDRLLRPVTEEDAEPHPSQYQGEQGERLEFRAIVVSTKPLGSGPWGPTTLVTLQDEAENQYITFTTGKVPRGGSSILARGTVKAHKEYRDVKQTQLSRLWFKYQPEA